MNQTPPFSLAEASRPCASTAGVDSARLLGAQVAITVYQDVSEQDEDARGYLPIAKYGAEFAAHRQPVAVLFTQGNHYDLLTK